MVLKGLSLMLEQLTVPRFFTETQSPNLVGRIADVADGQCFYEVYNKGVLAKKQVTEMNNILRNIKLGNLIWQVPKGMENAS